MNALARRMLAHGGRSPPLIRQTNQCRGETAGRSSPRTLGEKRLRCTSRNAYPMTKDYAASDTGRLSVGRPSATRWNRFAGALIVGRDKESARNSARADRRKFRDYRDEPDAVRCAAPAVGCATFAVRLARENFPAVGNLKPLRSRDIEKRNCP